MSESMAIALNLHRAENRKLSFHKSNLHASLFEDSPDFSHVDVVKHEGSMRVLQDIMAIHSANQKHQESSTQGAMVNPGHAKHMRFPKQRLRK